MRWFLLVWAGVAVLVPAFIFTAGWAFEAIGNFIAAHPRPSAVVAWLAVSAMCAGGLLAGADEEVLADETDDGP